MIFTILNIFFKLHREIDVKIWCHNSSRFPIYEVMLYVHNCTK